MSSSKVRLEKGQAIRSLLSGLLEDRAFIFETYKNTKLRTVGTGFVLPSEWNSLGDWDEQSASAFTRMFDRQLNNSIAAARGKLIFVQPVAADREAALRCFQVKGKNAAPAFCGNATAAGAVIHAQFAGQSTVTFEAVEGKHSAQVFARVNLNEAAAGVDQSWRVSGQAVAEEVHFKGQRAVYCKFLNDYLIFEGPLPFDPLTLLQSPSSPVSGLSAKLVVIERCMPVPRATFFNCNEQHGAAPQTGLATLAYASLRVPWINDLTGGGLIQHPSGIEALPNVKSLNNETISVSMPKVEVRFSPLLTSSLLVH